MYPPVGPKITCIPPLKPEKTGSPTIPRSINTATDTAPFLEPKITAVSIIPRVPRVTGIMPVGTVITENTHISAAKIAQITIVFVFIRVTS